MIHFATGTSGINFLCNQHGFKLMLVDAGVDFDFPEELGILCKKYPEVPVIICMRMQCLLMR